MFRRFIALSLCLMVAASASYAGKKKKVSDMDKALEQMQAAASPDAAVAPMEFILAHADRAPVVDLFVASAAAMGNDREDAAFLYYIGQLRAQLDLKRFPPEGQGGDDAGQAIAAIKQGIGPTLNPAIMRQPVAYKSAIERVAQWHPVTPKDYEPGWTYARVEPESDALDYYNEYRHEWLLHMQNMATLLNDAKYFSAFKTLQDYNMATDPKARPSEKAKNAAEKTMRDIETSRQIEGLYYEKNPQ